MNPAYSAHIFASMSGILDLSRDEKAKHFYVQRAPMGTA